MSDLMERLARANPVSSGEPRTAAELQDADALFERLVAEPLREPRPRPSATRPRLRPRRLAVAGALGALVIAAAVVVTDLLNTEGRPDSIVERAVAALSDDEAIYAMTQRQTVVIRYLDGSGKVERERAFGHAFAWRDHASRFLAYKVGKDGRPGALESETVFAGSRMTQWLADGNTITKGRLPESNDDPPAEDEGAFPGFDPFSDPGPQLRAHIDEGALRVAGRVRVGGRSAYRLVSKTLSDREHGILAERVTYLVDARTFLPVGVRYRHLADYSDVDPVLGGRQRVVFRIDYPRYEKLPVTPANERLLRMGSHPGAQRLP